MERPKRPDIPVLCDDEEVELNAYVQALEAYCTELEGENMELALYIEAIMV